MKKIIIISIIMLVLNLVGCSTYEIKSNSDISNINNLDFEFDVNPKNFEVSIKSSDNKEIISKPIQERKVTNLKKNKDFISWEYPNDKIEVKITKKDKYLDVKIKSNKDGEAKFSWPNISGDSYYLPINEGKFIPNNDKYFKVFLDNNSYNTIESFSMQFFSVNQNDKSIVYIIDNKFNNEIIFDTKNKINFTFEHEFPSINKNKEYGFRIYLTKNDISEVAKVYKNYILEKGEFKSLKEKAKENKNIEKLYGAPHIYFWDKSIITTNDIKWNKLKRNLDNEFINYIKSILINSEDSDELINVFDQIQNQNYIDNYQKNQIVKSFNYIILQEKFYNKDIFKGINKNIKKLRKTELIELNKNLLKSKLKDAVSEPNSWTKYNTIDIINEMNQSGIKKAWIGFDDIEDGHVSPKLIDKAKELGYLVGIYDSYHSIHEPGKEKWSTAKFEDESLYEDATIEDKLGKKLLGFQGEGRKLNPTLSIPSVKRRVSKVINDGYEFNSWFIDCDATGEIYDDYSKIHTTTEDQDLKARLERMSYIRDKKNMVIGSEGGNDFASKTIAFAHGIETPAFSWVDPDMNKNKHSEYYVGRYYSPTGGVPEVFSKQVPVKDLYKKIFIDGTYSIPLFRLVYNDSVITTHQWLWGTFKIKDEVNSRMMKEILYNIPPMYHLDREQWGKHRKDIVNHTKVWSEFNKKAIKEEMTEFKFLSEDRLIQMSKFGDNLKVVANFSEKEYKYNEDSISPSSLIIYEGNNKVEYKPDVN